MPFAFLPLPCARRQVEGRLPQHALKFGGNYEPVTVITGMGPCLPFLPLPAHLPATIPLCLPPPPSTKGEGTVAAWQMIFYHVFESGSGGRTKGGSLFLSSPPRKRLSWQQLQKRADLGFKAYTDIHLPPHHHFPLHEMKHTLGRLWFGTGLALHKTSLQACDYLHTCIPLPPCFFALCCGLGILCAGGCGCIFLPA